MVQVAIRSPGDKRWTRKTEIVEFRTFYGVLQHMARELRRRGVTHVVLEASGIYTEPVYYALAEQDFTEVAVINPAHAKALKGHKTAGTLADLSPAVAGRFTEHPALLCRLHRDRIAVLDAAVADLDQRIAGKAARWQREADLLTTVPGFGDVVAWAWLGEIGPAPHQWFPDHEKLACWVTLCPGNNISARKRKHSRTGDAGTYIKPMLVQAAWAAIRVRGRLQARYSRLVRRFGGGKNPGAEKKAITAIAPTPPRRPGSAAARPAGTQFSCQPRGRQADTSCRI